ncbi:hypothetical protein BH18THE1_BH18THE1_02950 [soil metagenome]
MNKIIVLGIVGIVFSLGISSAYAQETKFAPCIIMWIPEQVVLEESSNCSTALFNDAVSYYKSQGFHMTSYSNIFHQIITLTK